MYRDAAERFPDFEFATAIGGVYLLQEDYRQAEIEFRKLLETERPLSHKSQGYRALVMLNGHLGKYQEVLRLCEQLIELDAKSENTARLPQAYVLKAFWLAYGLNDTESARKAVQKGLSYPGHANEYFYQGIFKTYTLIGEYEKASDLAKKLLGNNRFLDRVLNGLKQKTAGNLEAAIGDFKFVSEKGGSRIIGSYNLALCYFEQGRYNLAIQAAQRTLKLRTYISLEILHPGWRAAVYARTFYLLGKIYQQQGDTLRAIENYEKFLDLWKNADADLPDLTDAKARYARLKQE